MAASPARHPCIRAAQSPSRRIPQSGGSILLPRRRLITSAGMGRRNPHIPATQGELEAPPTLLTSPSGHPPAQPPLEQRIFDRIDPIDRIDDRRHTQRPHPANQALFPPAPQVSFFFVPSCEVTAPPLQGRRNAVAYPLQIADPKVAGASCSREQSYTLMESTLVTRISSPRRASWKLHPLY